MRNWTVGELGAIAASAGIIVDFLASHPDVMSRLRQDPAGGISALDVRIR